RDRSFLLLPLGRDALLLAPGTDGLGVDLTVLLDQPLELGKHVGGRVFEQLLESKRRAIAGDLALHDLGQIDGAVPALQTGLHLAVEPANTTIKERTAGQRR